MVTKKKSSLIYFLKIILSEWTKYGEIGALKNASSWTNILLKFVFIFIFLTSATYCVSSVWTSLNKYKEFNTVTSLKMIYESPTPFPVISFCSLKRLNKTSAKSFLESILYDNNNKNSLVMDISEYDNDALFDYYYDIFDFIMLNLAKINTSEDFRKNVGFTIDNMLLSCKFNLFSCSKNDFKYFFHTQYGNCYSFNTENEVKQSIFPGSSYGLSMELFLGDPNLHSEFEMDDGIIIVVHNQSDLPFLNSDRVFVATGTETDIKINRNFIFKLGPPYSECIHNNQFLKSEFYDYIVNELHIRYTQQHCYSLCLQKFVIKNCGCSSNWLLNFKNLPYCNHTKIGCISENVKSGLSGKIPNNCEEKCPMECEVSEYKVTTSRISYPSPYLKKMLIKNNLVKESGITVEEIDKTVLKFNIYYESLAYRVIAEKESITAQIFFSNLGGTLGLCLGLSILSLVKVVGFLVSILIALKDRNCEINKSLNLEKETISISSRLVVKKN